MTTDGGDSRGSLRRAVIRGSAWMVAARWAVRVLGVISTSILARLLTPADFGLVAMSTLFVAILETVTAFGVDIVLIQRQAATREEYDTAWTVRLAQALVVALAVVALSPVAADFFGEPRVESVMLVLSLSVAFSGLQNIGVVAFRKDMEFGREFAFRVTAKVASVVVTLALAVWWRNYWALAGGIVTGALITVGLSYIVHPYRPRLSRAKLHEIWAFSRWVLVRNVGMFIKRQVDGFVVGRFFATDQMGVYRVASEVAHLPTTELIWPMAEAAFPGYARLARDRSAVGRAYLKVLGAIATLALPAGIGLSFVAEPLVDVLLGDQWGQGVPLLAWLAPYGVVLTISTTVFTPLMALDRPRRVAGLVWAQVLLVLPTIVLAAQQHDLLLISQVQLVTSAVLLPVCLYGLTSLSVVTWRGILGVLWRPAAASLAMAACLLSLELGTWMPTVAPLRLLVTVPIGVVAFSGSILVLWQLCGRPDSAEGVFLDVIRGLVSRRSR